MERYEPEVPSDITKVPELVQFLIQELRRVSLALAGAQENPLPELHVAPTKLREGMIVLADGTDWNPGSGKGIYAYYSGAWNKL